MLAEIKRERRGRGKGKRERVSELGGYRLI